MRVVNALSTGRVALRGGLLGLAVLLCAPAIASAAARSWGAPIALDTTGGMPTLYSVSCPSATQCTTVDSQGQEVTYDPGSPGTPTAVGIGLSPYAVVACPTVSQCTAADGSGEVTFDPQSPGAPAAPVQIDSHNTSDGNPGINAMSCPTVTQCTAVAPNGDESTFNPQSPTTSPSPSVVLIDPNLSAGLSINWATDGVVCQSTTQCVAGDIYGNVYNFDPQTVSSSNLPSAFNPDSANGFDAMACAPAAFGSPVTQCTGVDYNGDEVTFNPTTGAVTGTSSSPIDVDGSQSLFAVSCPSTSQCTAVDPTQQVTFDPTTTTGNLISGPTVIATSANYNSLFDINCPTTGECTAVDGSGNEVTFNPLSPGTPSPVAIDTRQPLDAVSCPSATQCTAIDRPGHEFTFDPATGTASGGPVQLASFTTVDNGLTDVACPTVTECVAVGQQGTEVTFDPATGTIASPASTIDPAIGTPGPGNQSNLLQSLSCPSAGQCTAVDGPGREVTFDPGAPGSAPAPVTVGAGFGVSCPSTTQCTSVNFTQEVTFDPATGTTIGSLTTIDNGGEMQGAIDCPSSTQCTAADSSGQVMTFNPQSPPATPTPTPVTTDGIFRISCPTVSDCVASTGSPDVVEGDPAQPNSWTTNRVSRTGGFSQIVCVSVAECVGVDAAGNALVGTTATPTAVACSPASVVVGASVACTATVTDQAPLPSVPSGTVSFASSGPGTFGAARCTLAAGTGAQSSCQVSYTPSGVGSGTHRITATYSGDTSHAPSSGTATISVSAAGGSGGARPAASTGGVSGVGQLSATVLGTANPEGSSTSYRFQYGPTSSYGGQTAQVGAGAGSADVAAHALLSGLRAGSTYHYRIVATNAAGTSYGADATFKTRPKVSPRGLSHSVSPRHARSAPYRFRFSGRLLLPRGVSRGNGCRGTVTIAVRHGRHTVWSRRARLSSSCRYGVRAVLAARRLGGRGRLKVFVRFLGNGVLLARSAAPFEVLFG